MSQGQSLGLGGVALISKAGTLATSQYCCVIMDTANADGVVIAGSNALILGVLQNKPLQNEIAEVRGVRGSTTKVYANAATSKGDKLQVSSNLGYVQTGASTAQLICGVGLEAATAQGDLIEMFLLDSYVA